MSKRSNEPFLWLLFSAGGVVSAMLMPIHAFLFGLGVSIGMAGGPGLRKPCWHWPGIRYSSVSAGVLRSSAVPLGPPIPLYTLRWFADQTPE